MHTYWCWHLFSFFSGGFNVYSFERFYFGLSCLVFFFSDVAFVEQTVWSFKEEVLMTWNENKFSRNFFFFERERKKVCVVSKRLVSIHLFSKSNSQVVVAGFFCSKFLCPRSVAHWSRHHHHRSYFSTFGFMLIHPWVSTVAFLWFPLSNNICFGKATLLTCLVSANGYSSVVGSCGSGTFCFFFSGISNSK